VKNIPFLKGQKGKIKYIDNISPLWVFLGVGKGSEK
jgi:hypothetical protein